MRASTELPPPPLQPELPPEVRLAGEQDVEVAARDGTSIEALGHLPASAERAVVLCHPHPLYGGTMHNAIMVSVARRLLQRGSPRAGWLRLNFRGVGRSGGRYDEGRSELLDVLGALDAARRIAPRAHLSLVGYSFGAGVAYRAAARVAEVDRVALVAPSSRLFPQGAPAYDGPVLVVAADLDAFSTVEETTVLAERTGGALHWITGADHFFVRFRREVAETVVSFAVPELCP